MRLLPLLLPLLLTTASPAENLKTLATQSREEAKACATHFESVAAIAGTPIEISKDGSFIFSSKAVALKILEKLPGYPGQPKSTAALVIALQKSKPSELWPLFELGDCRTVGYYGVHKNLATSAAHYSFTAAEKKRVAGVTLDYVRKDLDSPLTLLDVLIRLSLLENLHAQGILTLPPAKKTKIEALKKDADDSRKALQASDWSKEMAALKSEADYAKVKPATQKLLFDSILAEMRLADRLRGDLRALAADL